MESIDAISPIDGRYRRQTEPLAGIFSERGLIGYRVRVEGEYLIKLLETLDRVRVLSDNEVTAVRDLYNVSAADAARVKEIEKRTNHDVKAVEYFMREKFQGTSLSEALEWIHFGLTSEDVNNIAYGLMLSDGVGDVIIPSAQDLMNGIEELAQKYKSLPMLARTHGQPASPTTVGKELKVFSHRMKRQLDQLADYEILVKLNGATGNYNAHYAAFPSVDWLGFTEMFVGDFNGSRLLRLKPNLVTTQIESHDTYAELFDALRRLNVVVIDFDQDMWRYISDDWIKQKPKEGEVGSSTMPHKVNPIDFENSEGNLGIANALLGHFSLKLPVSRLQRDLSDSTVERNFGTALAHCLIGYKAATKGLGKCEVNEQKVTEYLDAHPEVVSEAIQTILRREGVESAYDKLKDMTRGRKVTLQDFELFIDGLPVEVGVKEELKSIKPSAYTGLAEKIVRE